jgi:predicted dehydrogenase
VSPSRPHRLALIGTGASIGNHLEAIRQTGARANLVAAVDVDEARVRAVCEQRGIPAWYTDAREMLRSERPDLVHIVTPPFTHTELSLACLEAGAWVLCEKPLCASLAEFNAIEQAERSSGCFVSTVSQWRYGSAARHVRRLYQEGALGRALVAVCNTLWYRTEAYYSSPWRGRWSGDVGGPSATLGIHLMDLCLWLLGEWEEVSAQVATLDRPIEVEDVSMALVRFEGGTLATMTNSALSPRQATYLRLDFQRATVELDALYRASNENWRFSLPEGVEDAEALARWRALDENVPGAHQAQLAEILGSLERGERPLVSGAEARRMIEFLTCLYKSALTGRPVRRGEVTAGDPFYRAMNGAPGETREAPVLP